MQVIPAYRLARLQARLVVMESIHKRIKRLREAKGLSQEALARIVGVRYQSVQEWERENGTAPSRKRQPAVAKALGVSVAEMMSATTAAEGPAASNPAAVAKDGKEEILLHLYRGLFSLQQAKLIQSLRALFDANQITRKELGQKPLRGVSDADVERAFGKIPPLRRPPKKARRSDPMDDFLDDA